MILRILRIKRNGMTYEYQVKPARQVRRMVMTFLRNKIMYVPKNTEYMEKSQSANVY